ncbi:MAG TPA: glycosyltransferase family 2 protein [Acidimicrobiales bacterium]|jgi:glycosyltransferase involved in cell wall biosynthesis|nr:glycosyltransferase family 2 protein [Acidimicrobiales bacterium]
MPAPYDVILPTLDEREALPSVLASLPPGYRAIVVDNGSTDGSGQLAASLGALVVSEPQRGFGAACWAGLQAATSEIVCFMDCDGSLDGAELPLVTGPVEAGTAELVMGRRVPVAGAWPLHARVANRVLASQVRRRCQVDVRDLGPMRAVGREALLSLGMEDRRFGWPLEMVVKGAARGWRVDEVPVGYARRAGRSKVTGTVRGTVRTIRDMRSVLR